MKFSLTGILGCTRFRNQQRHPQFMKGCQNCRTFYRAAVSRMQINLMFVVALMIGNIDNDIGSQLAVLAIINLPANNLAAKQLHK